MIFHKPVLKASIPPELDFNLEFEHILFVLSSEVRNILKRIRIAFVSLFSD